MQKVTTQEMIVLLNEIGEQAVVAMVERGSSEERDPIMEMLARKVQIINAIAERVQEMTAVEYLEACNKICDGIDGCSKCWLEPHCPFLAAQEFPSRAVEIVKRWKEEQS